MNSSLVIVLLNELMQFKHQTTLFLVYPLAGSSRSTDGEFHVGRPLLVPYPMIGNPE